MNKYNTYDKIVAESLQEIITLRNKGKNIILSPDLENLIFQKYVYKILLIACSLDPTSKTHIYISGNLFKYIKFKLKHFKDRKFIKKAYKKLGNRFILNPTVFCDKITINQKEPIYIIEDIYNEYYK